MDEPATLRSEYDLAGISASTHGATIESKPMSRLRSADYGDKKSAILDAAATLFAENGYAGCKMEDIAAACSVSKSMLYHYFKKKEDILYEILHERITQIIEVLEQHEIQERANPDMDQYFCHFVAAYLERSRATRSRHVVALHDRRYLPAGQHKRIVKLERKVIDLVVTFLRQHISPNRSDVEYRAYALLLLGMVNWVEIWYRSSGAISPKELYSIVAKLFLHGFAEEQVSARNPIFERA